LHFSGIFHNNQYLTSACFYQLSDYPTFGSPMSNRQWNDPNSKYKYGFNGKEKDDDINVNGGDYDFGARIYDSRLGRFLSLDPLFSKNLHYSTYSFSANSPIMLIDAMGMDPVVPPNWWQGTNYVGGFLAGIVDGAWEAGNAAYDLVYSFNPLYPLFYTSRASKVRSDYYDMTKLVVKLFTDNKLRDKVYNSVKKALGDWFSETTFEKGASYAGYTHGKMIFDVLTALIGVAEVNYLLKTGRFSVKALRIITLNSIKKSIKSFDDIIKSAKLLSDKFDPKANIRRIAREFTGKGSASDHFDNLAQKLDGKIVEQKNGTKTFVGKDGVTYSLHNSTGGDGRPTITKLSKNKDGSKTEEKIRFNE